MQQKTEKQRSISTIKMKEAIIDKYKIIKVLLNGDILAQDHHQQLYILCHTQKKKYESKFIHFQDANIIQPVQIIEEEGNSYEVYPFEKKMIWAGDLSNHKEKSEIFCVTLLYSTIRHIIKPLKNSRNISNPSKYICLQNLWIRDTTVFLILRNKHRDNNLLRTQTLSGKKHSFRLKETSPYDNLTQISIIKRVGEVFWSIFYENQNIQKNMFKETFKELLKSMIHESLNLAQLEDIMQNNTARKTFINKKRNTIDINQTINHNRSIDQRYSSLNRQDQPMTTGIYRRLLFQSQRKKYIDQRQNGPSRMRFQALIDSQKNNIPPSFRKDKRFKRRSLFDESRSFSRGTAPVHRNQKNEKNHIFRQSLTPNQNNTMQNISFRVVNIDKKKPNNRYFINSNKRRSIIQISIQDSKTQTYIQSLQRKSEQKAMIKIKQLKSSIDSQRQDRNQTIDDQKLKIKLRQMSSKHKKQLINSSMIKVYESLSNNSRFVNNKNRFNREYANQLQKVANVDMILKERIIIEQKINDMEEMFIEKDLELKKGGNYVKQYQNNSYEPKQMQNHLSQRNRYNNNIQVKRNQSQRNRQAQNKKIRENHYPQYHTDFNIEPRINVNQMIKPTIQAHTNTNVTKNKEVTQMNKANSLNIIPGWNKIQDSPIIQQHNVQMISLVHQNSLNSALKEETQRYNQGQINAVNKKDNEVCSLNIIKQPSFQGKSNQNLAHKLQSSKHENKPNFFAQVEKNMFLQSRFSEDYVYVSKNDIKPAQIKQQLSQKDLSKPPIKKQKCIIRAPKITTHDLNDQIEQINLGVKKQISLVKIQKPLESNLNLGVEKKKKIAKLQSQQSNSQKSNGEKKSEKNIPNMKTEKSQKQPSQSGRMHTNQSNASSSNAGKSIRKQIDEYIHMINKMGEAVAKTAKLSKKLQGMEWYVGVYFLYKRFYHERKKIERYLQECIPKLTRYDPFNEQEWKQWLTKGQIDQLLDKCKEDNKNISASIKKMAKKIETKQLPGHVLVNAPLQKNTNESTLIAIEYVVDQYDQAVEKKITGDVQIFTHLCEMINALYVIAQLDKKIADKRPVQDYSNVKRSSEELSNMVQAIFDLYQ